MDIPPPESRELCAGEPPRRWSGWPSPPARRGAALAVKELSARVLQSGGAAALTHGSFSDSVELEWQRAATGHSALSTGSSDGARAEAPPPSSAVNFELPDGHLPRAVLQAAHSGSGVHGPTHPHAGFAVCGLTRNADGYPQPCAWRNIDTSGCGCVRSSLAFTMSNSVEALGLFFHRNDHLSN